MPLSQEPTVLFEQKNDEKEAKSDSQELWDGLDEESLTEFTLRATQIAANTLSRNKKKAPSREQVDAEENPFLADPPQYLRSSLHDNTSADAGPSNHRTSLARLPPVDEAGPSSSQEYEVFGDYDEDDCAEASRVEGILLHDSLEDEGAQPGGADLEGPPATQTTAYSSTTSSQHSYRTSFTSFTSIRSETSEVKLGKRRAADDRDPDFAVPRPKIAKVASEGAGRITLRTAQSDPGPSRAKSARPVFGAATENPAPESGVYIISHNAMVQAWLDELRIPWGVQYEIARGVSSARWKWNAVTKEKLKKLRGLNAESAFKVAAVILGTPEPRPTRGDVLLWEELDREQAALVESNNRGLGLQGEWMGVRSWYGGQIQQICRLQRGSKASPSLKLILGKMEMMRSHRFARFLGSRRVLQIKLPDSYDDKTAEKELLSQKFVLCGRIFRVFACKEEKAYAMEVNEDYDRVPSESEGDLNRHSLEDFVAWHNPLHLNARQPVSKWNARFDLGLSNSRPVLHFILPELIEIIDDEYAPLDDPIDSGKKPPAEKIYTDGCGFMNGAALKIIKDTLGLDVLPCAVQGRIFGSKGIWILHPDHQRMHGDLPRIWIRESQQKIRLALEMDPGELETVHLAHFIFDLVAVPRLGTNPHLNRHTIVNLRHNGVPVSAFAELMKAGVEAAIEPLLQFEGLYAMPMLWYNVNKAESVFRQRLLQYAAGAQRVLGLASRNDVNGLKDDDEDDPADEATQFATAHSVVLPPSKYFPGGKPVSVAERFLRLIGAGFGPEEEFTYEEHRKLRDRLVKAMFEKLRLPLCASAEAFMIPDPTGKLQETEIYFRLSNERFEDSPNIVDPRLLKGDCLLYRNPARLASDIQKVRAVDVPELALYQDVIVVPCKGLVSLPSMLAGGDVDGDTAICIWDPKLVKPFRNTELVKVPKGFKEENFEPEGEIITVLSLEEDLEAARVSRTQEPAAILQRHLVSGVLASRAGIYSKYHDLATYMFGYTDPETQRIALMFNFILDSRKSGMVVKPDVYRADAKRFDYAIPPCMGEGSGSDGPLRYALREKKLGRFVLDELQDAAKKIKEDSGKRYDAQVAKLQLKPDSDIIAFWERCSEEPILQDEMATVRDFVAGLHGRWQVAWVRSPVKHERYTSKKEAKKGRNTDDAKAREIAAEFNEGPPEAQTRALRNLGILHKVLAACAYSFGRKFAFNIAFTQLTLIKAEARGIAPITEQMSSLLTMPSSAAKVLMNRSEVVGG